MLAAVQNLSFLSHIGWIFCKCLSQKAFIIEDELVDVTESVGKESWAGHSNFSVCLLPSIPLFFRRPSCLISTRLMLYLSNSDFCLEPRGFWFFFSSSAHFRIFGAVSHISTCAFRLPSLRLASEKSVMFATTHAQHVRDSPMSMYPNFYIFFYFTFFIFIFFIFCF